MANLRPGSLNFKTFKKIQLLGLMGLSSTQ